MQTFLLDFIQNPDQDLDAFLLEIQEFWKAIGTRQRPAQDLALTVAIDYGGGVPAR